MKSTADRQHLRNSGRNLEVPFRVLLKSDGSSAELVCNKIMRIIPGKRIVCAGEWNKKPVAVKIFLSAGRHSDREIKGINALKNAGIKTIGLIYENSEFGKHAADEGKMAAEAAGFEIIANVAFNPGATNLNSEVQTLKAKNPDAVFGACLGGDYALWVRTMKQMNWLPKIALNYCSGYQDPMTTQQLSDDANFFMGGTGYSPEFAELMPAVAAVEEIYKAKTDPSVPFDSDSIQEAVALFILAQAIEKAGTLDIETVREVLYANEWESPLSMGGKVAFIAGGQNVKAMSMKTQLQNGAYVRVFPPELATHEIIYPMVPWDNR